MLRRAGFFIGKYMPLPQPKPDEDKDEFISRCMSDDTMQEEFPSEDQRRAVCETQWEEDEKGEDIMRKRSIFKPMAKGSYRVENKEDNATVYLYDEIGWFGVEAEQFVKDVNAITAKTIHVRLNSPGGSVFDGMAIYNTLKQHKSKVVAHIDGLAASITSVIAMAADEVRASEESYLMIHEPWSIVLGGAEDMRHEADLLDKVGGTISATYQRKSGKEADEIAGMMKAETWFTGAEALEAGFVDVLEEIGEDAKAKASPILFDLSVFANTPDTLMGDRQPPTERGMEKALRDAGCSRAQAKAILAAGLPEDLRDADPQEPEPAEVQNQREAGDAGQREADEPKAKDRVADLLIRAEQLKSTIEPKEDKSEDNHSV